GVAVLTDRPLEQLAPLGLHHQRAGIARWRTMGQCTLVQQRQPGPLFFAERVIEERNGWWGERRLMGARAADALQRAPAGAVMEKLDRRAIHELRRVARQLRFHRCA